jgi:uncharacterized protein (DUF2384 family)
LRTSESRSQACFCNRKHGFQLVVLFTHNCSKGQIYTLLESQKKNNFFASQTDDVPCGDKRPGMAKAAKNKRYTTNSKLSKVEEPIAMPYTPVKRLPAVADFPYSKFAKVAAKIPFTQKEWANILHLSEKTLQRYSKDNKSFEGLYVDRILQIEQLINMGLETFTDADAFYSWLKREKNVLGQTLQFESLYTTQGILDIIDQIARIQHGVYT